MTSAQKNNNQKKRRKKEEEKRREALPYKRGGHLPEQQHRDPLPQHKVGGPPSDHQDAKSDGVCDAKCMESPREKKENE